MLKQRFLLSPFLRLFILLFGFYPTLFLPNLSAFTVIKNVNTGKAPVEKIVLFEKGKGNPNLQFQDSEAGKFTLLEDGSLLCHLKGNQEVKSVLSWKEGKGIPASFDAGAYTFLVLTCRIEGVSRDKMPDGKILERRGDNLWIGPSLVNSAGERIGSANLADVADDKKTPATTATLNIPMLLFTDVTQSDYKTITGIGFFIQAARPTTDRDFKIIIDKIALAD